MYYEANASEERRRLATELFREKRGYLLAVARRNSASEADAEEALQDAFASFISNYDPAGEAPPLAWLVLTLKRRCWRLRERAHLDRSAGQETERGSKEPGFDPAAIPSPISGPAELVAASTEARHRLGRLKPDERTAVVLQAVGYSYKEIGDRRGWTYTKVNRCVNEGRAALRRSGAR